MLINKTIPIKRIKLCSRIEDEGDRERKREGDQETIKFQKYYH